MGDLQGAVIGRKLADKFGWKIGDRFFLESFIPPYRKRTGPFEFVVRGDLRRRHARSTRAPTPTLMFFHYKYLYEGTGRRVGAGTYTVEINDPEQAGAVSKAIDALFENSDAQTHTETEKAFAAGFISMAGNLALLLNGIGLAVCFTILLVTANTMSMAVRERRTEIAVLKTLGFAQRAGHGPDRGRGAAAGRAGRRPRASWAAAASSGCSPACPAIKDVLAGHGPLEPRRCTPPVAALGFARRALPGPGRRLRARLQRLSARRSPTC